MSVFAIFTGSESPDPAETEIELVPDRFSTFAFLSSGLWCIWHRLWVELALLVLAAILLLAVAALVNPETTSWLGLLVALFVGFEAGPIRERALIRRGFAHRADIVAGSAAEAEVKWLSRQRTVP
ncbi:MAG: DUF2628 domain-containing protein [Cucumibacter sp.]